MSPFIDDNFLLRSDLSRRLYHELAAPLPLIDYHNHLDVHTLAVDKRFTDLTELWIASDPYKHRAMRIAGVCERQITGDASPRTKFDHWAAVVPQTLGSPLYHWSALELKRYFGIDEPLSPASVDRIWRAANTKLASGELTARSLLARANVSIAITSDTASDGLEDHRALARAGLATRVLPSLRVDGLCGIPSEADTILSRLDEFHASGCRLADHSLDHVFYDPASAEADLFRRLARAYTRQGWTLQLHMGAQRRTSSRLRSLAGPAGGFAGAGAPIDIASLCRLLDDLERANALPRVILYPLNPADYAPLAILSGSFAEDGVRGKIQLGPAWWFNDHAQGITQHLSTLANYGLLSTFIGMTTDSRSLLSMVRHEYFRRIVCDWLGEQAERGAIPDDRDLIDPLVSAICHDNAADMLNLGERNG